MSDLIKRNSGQLDFFHSPFSLERFDLPFRMSGCGLFSSSLANYSTKETDESHVIKVSLPGHSKETVKVSIEDYKLTIEANSEVTGIDAELIQEHEFKFKLPKNCDVNNPSAKIENGILTIVIQKIQTPKETNKVEVKID